ncbi:MAG: hypothetical protein J6L59_00840 [Clostridia bacterium]|nr:hypothetical protein [Clostridia bacterium]
MKRALCWIMSVILLLNSSPPAFAAGCNFESMLKDAYAPGWMNMECVRDFACYCREKKCAYTKPTQQGVEQFVSRFESIQRESSVNHEKLVLFYKAVASLNKTFPGKLRFTFPEDFTPVNKETWTNLFDACSGDEKKTLHGKVEGGVRKQVSSQQEEPNRFDFCFGAGENSNAELTAKITHLAEMEKGVLYNALAVMVNGGSANPKEPDYVHPLILNAAFFLYAKKITAAEQGNIEKYLPHQAIYSNIDPKYASRVQLAAASALFAFAKKNPQAIKPKFSLASSYETVQNTLSASGVMVGALSVSVSLSFWEAVAAAGGELSASAAEFTAAIKAAASAAKPGVAVVSSSPLGATVAVVGGVAIFVYALNDAYTPGYKAIFNRAKERFWNEVFSSPDYSGVDAPILRVIPASWSAEFAKYGAAETTAENSATCQPKEPQQNCDDIQIKDLRSYLSLPEGQRPISASGVREYLRELQIPFSKSTRIKDLLLLLKPDDLVRDVFQFIINNCDSYTNSQGNSTNGANAFIRPRKDGDFIVPDIEVGVNIDNTLLTDVLSEEIIDTLCKDQAYLQEFIDLGNGRWIRNTQHEKENNHFHYEEGPCNHSIFFTGDNFIDKMRKICDARL